MIYFANINSRNELQCIGLGLMDKDQYGSSDVQNIEVAKEYYDNYQLYGNDYYIYDNGEIVVNPEYETIKLNEAKQAKYDEALSKAYEYEENGTVEYKNCVFEMSKSNRDNLRDTVDALVATGQTETTWNDKNDELVILTLEDIQHIRLNLILGNIQKLWITDYPNYLEQIDNAETVKEVEAIIIDYEIPAEG